MNKPESDAPDPWAGPKSGSDRPVLARVDLTAQPATGDCDQAAAPELKVQLVRITGIDMPFWSLAAMLLKLALAAVPALLLLLAMAFLVLLLTGFMLGSAIVSSLTGFIAELMKSVPWF